MIYFPLNSLNNFSLELGFVPEVPMHKLLSDQSEDRNIQGGLLFY